MRQRAEVPPRSTYEHERGIEQLDAVHSPIASLRNHAEQHPRDSRAWNALARALIATGNYRDARNAALHAARCNAQGDPTPGLINAGIASRELGDLDEANALFNRADACTERHPLIQFHRARIFRAKGEIHSATMAYIEAIAYAAPECLTTIIGVAQSAVTDLGSLTPDPTLSVDLRALVAAAHDLVAQRHASASRSLQCVIARTSDPVMRDASLIMLLLSRRNRERTIGERPS